MRWVSVIFTLIIILVAVASCRKDTYMSNAEIIGYDVRECPCCGGIEMTIDNVSPPQGGSFFLVSHMPSYYTIDSNATFPILVKINYVIDTTGCYGNFVSITKIANR
jgi:hypothetical protein